MKHDNLKIIGIAIQMSIPLNNGERRVALPNSFFVYVLPNLKIQDDKLHAHTVA